MKKWYKSKTIWVGIIEIVIGALGVLAAFLEVGDYSSAAITLLVSGIFTVVLRRLTKEPIK